MILIRPLTSILFAAAAVAAFPAPAFAGQFGRGIGQIVGPTFPPADLREIGGVLGHAMSDPSRTEASSPNRFQNVGEQRRRMKGARPKPR